MNQNNPLSKLKPTSIAIIASYVVIAVVLIYLAIQPLMAEWHYRIGFNLDAAKRYKYAVEELELAVKYAPWETQYQMQLGRTYESYADSIRNKKTKQSLLEEALKIYKNTIKIDHQNPWHHSRLAATALKLAELDPDKKTLYENLADKHMRLTVYYDTNNPLFHLNFAYYLHKKANATGNSALFEEAKEHYVNVLEKDPRMVEANYNLADIYRKEGKWDKVLANYLEIEKRKPGFNNLYAALADTYYKTGNIPKSIEYFQKEILANPGKAEPKKNLAILFYKEGQWKNSADQFKALFEEHPDHKDVFFSYYINALEKSGQIKTAISELETYLKEKPNKTYQQALNKLKANN